MTNAEKLIRRINDDWNDGNIDTLVNMLDHSCCRFCDNYTNEPVRTEHDGKVLPYHAAMAFKFEGGRTCHTVTRHLIVF